MPKKAIKVGFGVSKERMEDGKGTGVWDNTVIEKTYYPEVLKEYATRPMSSQVVPDLHLSNRFSIIADPYARQNYGSALYVLYRGVRWSIDSIEVAYPRLILSIGGVYNGPIMELEEVDTNGQ